MSKSDAGFRPKKLYSLPSNPKVYRFQEYPKTDFWEPSTVFNLADSFALRFLSHKLDPPPATFLDSYPTPVEKFPLGEYLDKL